MSFVFSKSQKQYLNPSQRARAHITISSLRGSNSVGIVRRGLLVLLLQLSKLVPAGVVFGFGGVGVFLGGKPEAKPVNCTALRNHPFFRACHNVLTVWNNNQVNRFPKVPQSGVRLPHTHKTVMIVEGDYL